jgi:hypothetical protein
VNATPEESSERPAELEKRPAAAWLIAGILGVQASAWTVLGVWVILELVTGSSTFLATAIFEAVLLVMSVGWMVVTILGILGTRSWSRSSLVALEVLHLAAAIAAFQGYLGWMPLGWFILVPAAAAIVLVFTPRMTARFAQHFQGD